MKTLEVLFTPADFAALKQQDLSASLCVVFDVFRATSSMITALANGAEVIIPVSEISEALAIRKRNPDVLLAGERQGLRIGGDLTGGIEFEFGNSPREFTRDKVAGKTIITTTTNGTRALRACAHAQKVLVSSFLNLQATASRVQSLDPENVLIICAGTFEQTALEDVLGAGALCDSILGAFRRENVSDAALMAHQIFKDAGGDVLAAASASKNGRKLLSIPNLKEDVAFCMRRDVCDFAAVLRPDGMVVRCS